MSSIIRKSKALSLEARRPGERPGSETTILLGAAAGHPTSGIYLITRDQLSEPDSSRARFVA